MAIDEDRPTLFRDLLDLVPTGAVVTKEVIRLIQKEMGGHTLGFVISKECLGLAWALIDILKEPAYSKQAALDIAVRIFEVMAQLRLTTFVAPPAPSQLMLDNSYYRRLLEKIAQSELQVNTPGLRICGGVFRVVTIRESAELDDVICLDGGSLSDGNTTGTLYVPYGASVEVEDSIYLSIVFKTWKELAELAHLV